MEKEFTDEAKRLGIVFNGIQKMYKKGSGKNQKIGGIFTDILKTESSFVAWTVVEIERILLEQRALFAEGE